MSQPTTSTLDLESFQHECRRRREWIAEKIGWAVIALLLLAALAGLAGHGPLNSAHQSSGDGRLAVDYQPIERYQSPTELRIRFQSQSRETRLIRVGFSREFAEATAPDKVIPEPASVELQPHRVIYTFQILSPAGEETIIYRYKHIARGRLRYAIWLEDAAEVNAAEVNTEVGAAAVSVSQFVYP